MPPIINIKRKIKRERNAAMRETAKRSTLIENMLKAKLHFSAQTQQGHTTRIWWLGKHSQCNSSGDLRDIAQTLPKLNLDWRQDCQSFCLFLRQDGLQLCTINVLQSQRLWNSDWGVARLHSFYLTKRTSWAECALMEWPQMCERHPPGALGGPRLGLHTTKHSP